MGSDTCWKLLRALSHPLVAVIPRPYGSRPKSYQHLACEMPSALIHTYAHIDTHTHTYLLHSHWASFLASAREPTTWRQQPSQSHPPSRGPLSALDRASRLHEQCLPPTTAAQQFLSCAEHGPGPRACGAIATDGTTTKLGSHPVACFIAASERSRGERAIDSVRS